MAVTRKETVASSAPARANTSNSRDNSGGGGGGLGGLVNQIAKAAASTSRGVFNQVTGKPQARGNPKRGIDRPTNQAPMINGRRETVDPRYAAILKAQGYSPSANGSYAQPRPQPSGNPGRPNRLPVNQGGGWESPSGVPGPDVGGNTGGPYGNIDMSKAPADTYGWDRFPASTGGDFIHPFDMWIPAGGWDDNPEGLTPPRGNWSFNNLPPGWRYLGDPAYPFDPGELAPIR